MPASSARAPRAPVRPPKVRSTWLLLAALAVWGCGEDKMGPPPTPTGIQASAGDGQTAAAGTAVPTAPAVLVTSANGPLAGVTVTFAVTSGNGSVTGASATSNGNGIATVGSWVLGTTAGTHTLSATVAGLAPVSFAAQALAGPPSNVSATAGNNQTATINTPVPVRPAVRVRDQFNNVIAAAAVQFAVTGGGGSVTGADALTDANGIATVGSWTLGPTAGVNTLVATVAGPGVTGNPVTFTAVGEQLVFDITVRFSQGSAPTPTQQQWFHIAAARWEQLLIGDLPGGPLNLPAGSCAGADYPAINETVDDVIIYSAAVPIDGPGGVLGIAGPCFVRSGTFLPVLGGMQFDTADLATLEAQGRLLEVILHEMGHVLGFGTIWSSVGFLQNPSCGGTGSTCNPDMSGADTHMNGANAIASFDNVGGTAWTLGSKVPVENTQGGPGTRDAHWRESTFGNELMTGFLSGGANPLSEVTTASMLDMGYQVDLSKSDGYTLANPNALRAPVAAATIELVNDVYRGPLTVIDQRGRVVRIIEPR